MTKTQRRARAGARNQLRIIGGTWRGRRLHFPDVPGLRPSADRVRETVFNWLQIEIPGARCLDLFAGSGALGLEALSRGASKVVFVDRDARAGGAVRDHLKLLQAEGGMVEQGDVLAFLSGEGEPFDVVFADPPFRQGLLEPVCRLLTERGWIRPGTRIYLEAEQELGTLSLPPGWQLLRSRTAGQVGYHLAVYAPADK